MNLAGPFQLRLFYGSTPAKLLSNLSSLNYRDNYYLTSMNLISTFFFFHPENKRYSILSSKPTWSVSQRRPAVCLSPGGKYLQWFGRYIESRLIESQSACQILCYLLSWKAGKPALFTFVCWFFFCCWFWFLVCLLFFCYYCLFPFASPAGELINLSASHFSCHYFNEESVSNCLCLKFPGFAALNRSQVWQASIYRVSQKRYEYGKSYI